MAARSVTLGDFDGVEVAGFSPHLLVVHAALAARTTQEFLALPRANPGRYNCASAGPGSGPHIGGLLLMARMNPQAETVHERGGGPSVAALVTGEAHFGTPTMASAIGQVRGGRLRALARQGVRLIALRCAGFNNIALKEAHRLGIRIARVPAYSPEAVAEQSVAMMLALNRRIHRAHARVREGNFALDGLLGFDMKGRIVGPIITGRIMVHAGMIKALAAGAAGLTGGAWPLLAPAAGHPGSGRHAKPWRLHLGGSGGSPGRRRDVPLCSPGDPGQIGRVSRPRAVLPA